MEHDFALPENWSERWKLQFSTSKMKNTQMISIAECHWSSLDKRVYMSDTSMIAVEADKHFSTHRY